VEIDGERFFLTLHTAHGDAVDVSDVTPRLENALAVVGKVSARLLEGVKQLRPSELAIEVGLSFGLDSGEILAAFVDLSSESTIRVTLRWTDAEQNA